MPTTTETPPGVLAALRRTPAPIRFLLAGVLINQLGAFVQTFMVIYMLTRGFPLGDTGLALAAYSVGSVLGGVAGGEMTQRFGPRTTIVTAMLSSALCLAAIPAVAHPSSTGALVTVLLLAGLATQSYRPAAAMLLSFLMPADIRVMGFSMMRIALNLGAAVSPLIAAALIPINASLLLWIDAATATTFAALAVVMLPPVRLDQPAAPATPADARTAYRTLFRDSRFWLFLASVALGSIIYVQYTVALPLKITFAGHPATLYSTVLITASTVLILCELKITSYVSRWPGHLAATTGTLLMALGIAGFGISGTSAVALVGCTIVFVFGIMINGPTMFAYPATFPASVRARYISAHQTTFGAGMAAGPLVGVTAWVHLGDGVWWLCGGLGLLAALCALIGMRPTASARPVPAGGETVAGTTQPGRSNDA